MKTTLSSLNYSGSGDDQENGPCVNAGVCVSLLIGLDDINTFWEVSRYNRGSFINQLCRAAAASAVIAANIWAATRKSVLAESFLNSMLSYGLIESDGIVGTWQPAELVWASAEATTRMENVTCVHN